MFRPLKALYATPALVGLLALACATPPTIADSNGDVVARIGDRKITLAEVDNKAKGSNMDAYQKLYEARRAALDEIVAEALVAAEAKTKGVSKDALLDAEVTKKVQPVSDADVEAFYNERKSQMGNQALEAIAPRIREFLQQQNVLAANTTYIDGLKKKANVRTSLEPPRVEVLIAENDPTRGPANAPIVLVEFSEFQ